MASSGGDMTNKASCQTAKRKSVTLGLDGVGENTKADKKANIIIPQLHYCSATMNIKPCADVLQMRGEDHIEAASPDVKIVDAPAVHMKEIREWLTQAIGLQQAIGNNRIEEKMQEYAEFFFYDLGFDSFEKIANDLTEEHVAQSYWMLPFHRLALETYLGCQDRNH
jgi:hypothetical protein